MRNNFGITSSLLIIFGYLLVAFGQPAWMPLFAPFAACIGYACFWYGASSIAAPIKKFWISVAWYAGVQAIQLSWMTAIEFQGYYILSVYVGLIFLLSLQFGLFSHWVLRSTHWTLLRVFAMASLWTLMEWSRVFFLSGFSWNPAGLALTASQYSLQWASVFGIFGLSFWVMASNIGAFAAFSTQDKRLRYAIFTCAIALFPYLFGFLQVMRFEGKESQNYLEVALIQTNWLPSEKIPLPGHLSAYIAPLDQWDSILTALGQGIAKERVDLLVLPEAAVPHLAGQPRYPYERVEQMFRNRLGDRSVAAFPHSNRKWVSNLFFAQAIANFYQAHLVLGLDDRDEVRGENYQAAFHVSPDGSLAERYEKQILLPLAEYLPFAWLKTWTAAYGIQDFYTQGKGAKIWESHVLISPSICYEETFSNCMRQGRLKGAELFVNVTNDNWYPHSQLARQHFDLSRLRSVENGIPLVRACNQGMSAAFDSLGRVVNKKHDPLGQKRASCEVILASVPLFSHKTIYTIFGDAGIVALSILLILCLFKNNRSILLKIARSAKFLRVIYPS